MMEEILVSIITPVYNGEQYLEVYFKNILRLDYRNLEVIIVNDGSTDNSSSIVEKYKEKDKRVILINKRINGGVSAARNSGLDIAGGKYIFFFDCDDTFEDYSIRHAVEYAERNQYDTVLYNYAVLEKNGIIKHRVISYLKKEYEKEDRYELLSSSMGISISDVLDGLSNKKSFRDGKELNGPWRMMYSRDIIKKNRLEFDCSLRVGEDTIFTNEYLSNIFHAGVLNEVLYYLHENEGSAIQTYHQDCERRIRTKIQLIKAKKELSERIEEKTGVDCRSLWGGEYILSSIEIAWALVSERKMTFHEKVLYLQEYHLNASVKECWKKITYRQLFRNFSIKTAAVLMMKCNMMVPVLIILMILKRSGNNKFLRLVEI